MKVKGARLSASLGFVAHGQHGGRLCRTLTVTVHLSGILRENGMRYSG